MEIMDDCKKISIIVSVYNEEQSLNSFYDVIMDVLKNCRWDYEIVFVNDGSTDQSLEILTSFAEKNSKIKVVNFVRNFGHEAAMIAGIDYSDGNGMICMDADLQHPPEMIPAIVEKFEEGYEVISMIRTKNEGVGKIRNFFSDSFYKILNLISPVKFENNSSDFFAFSEVVATVLKQEYREKVRYLRGYVQSVGFRKTTLNFEARKREAGESKYNLKKLISFSLNALCSFSDFPLKLGIYFGGIVGFFGIVLMIYTIVDKFVNGAPGGYTTIVVLLCFLFAVTFFLIGIIGEYIAILFSEIKNRPIYIVRNVLNEKKALENSLKEEMETGCIQEETRKKSNKN